MRDGAQERIDSAARRRNPEMPVPGTPGRIPHALRRAKPRYRSVGQLHWRFLLRIREDPQFLRSTVQVTFAILCVWIGIEFHLFMAWGLSGGEGAAPPRPPGVEGFLPISALITLGYWLSTGMIAMVHPAAMFILLAVASASLLVKKSFCSWLCPIGTLSESLWMLGKRITGRTFDAPRWLDYPLRSLKYLLLLFFVVSIASMDTAALRTFLFSPYHKVADVKMYVFFAQISTFALWTIIVLMLLSVFVRNSWCRFLCPYGALLGIVGWLSPLKITRKASTCIDCKLCTRACPSNIRVHTARRVWSDECTSCLACVQVCPVRDTLEVRARKGGRAVPSWVVGGLVAGAFITVTGLAMLTGTWQNAIGTEEYQRRFRQLDSPVYQHFQGKVPPYGPND